MAWSSRDGVHVLQRHTHARAFRVCVCVYVNVLSMSNHAQLWVCVWETCNWALWRSVPLCSCSPLLFFSSFPRFCLCLKMASSHSARWGVKDEFWSTHIRIKQCWKPEMATPSSDSIVTICATCSVVFFFLNLLHFSLQKDISDDLMSLQMQLHCCLFPLYRSGQMT